MTVYVDDVAIPFGRMKMCHMWADTHEELLAMADRIGVARRWLQQPPKASWVHFDISVGMKARALGAGAVLTDRFGPAECVARREIATGKPAAVTRGKLQLARIANSRALRAEPAAPDLFTGATP